MVDEAEHSLHDALSAVPDDQGHPSRSQWRMFRDADELCRRRDSGTTKGKKVIAVEAFAHASWQIPADNAGYDSSDLVTRLRAVPYGGQMDLGTCSICIHRSKHAADDDHRHEREHHWVDEEDWDHGEL